MVIRTVNAEQEAEAYRIAGIENSLPEGLHGQLARREGAAMLARELPKVFSPLSLSDENSAETQAWVAIAQFYYFNPQNRLAEALAIFAALYDQMLVFQQQTGQRCHKGLPLVWISDCYQRLGCGLISRRYLMLTLVEDAIRENGHVSTEKTGTYFRFVWTGRLSHAELERYAKEANELNSRSPIDALYPEWVLLELDNEWISQAPDYRESGIFLANERYIEHLIGKLGDGSGKALEMLAEYLMSCMPGCRTSRRRKSRSTDYDMVCSIEGLDLDFRSEFGRYFVCECKDWDEPADFTTMAKFCRVLDSVKARFGILFSKQGISGSGKRKYADSEQLKVFQDRGIVIVVVDQNDLQRIANGANFISMLREKYEAVRLDLTPFPEMS